MNTPDFPKGFASWQKTHFEVVEVLVYIRGLESGKITKGFASIFDQTASEELYAMALNLTNKYEEQTKGKERTRSLFEDIEEFVWAEVEKPGSMV